MTATTTTTTDMTPFAYDGHQVRVITRDGEPWFILTDLCKVLGLSNSSEVARRLDPVTLSSTESQNARGQARKTAITSEPGLYEVIFMSRKPEAKAFKRWVTHEVLPSIRRHGVYATDDAVEAMLADPDSMIRALTALKEERARREAVEADHRALTAQVEADAPHTRFGRTISGTDGDLLVKQVADLITQGGAPISQVTLFRWLRKHGWLCRNQGRLWNAPTKRALEQGYVRSTVLVVSTSHGDREKTTPRITATGQEDLIDGWLTGRYTNDLTEEDK